MVWIYLELLKKWYWRKNSSYKLTNAYNREFFGQNYKKFISEYSTSNSKLEIAMLDIDH